MVNVVELEQCYNAESKDLVCNLAKAN